MRITEGEERETVTEEIVEGMNRYKFSKINANHQIIGPGRSKNSKQEIPNNPQIGTSYSNFRKSKTKRKSFKKLIGNNTLLMEEQG